MATLTNLSQSTSKMAALTNLSRRAVLSAVKLPPQIQQVASMGGGPKGENREMAKIGNREVVGFGFNGDKSYADRIDYPFPAIRFKESTPDIQALREKEKGDWRKLTDGERKALYRASFGQTFSEMKAPTGEWKALLGLTLAVSSISVWIYMGMKMWVYFPMPDTFSPERQNLQLQRMIDTKHNPIQGPSSHWDYEKADWKK